MLKGVMKYISVMLLWFFAIPANAHLDKELHVHDVISQLSSVAVIIAVFALYVAVLRLFKDTKK